MNNRLGCTQDNVLTVWSDIGCPWATLALHTLHRSAAQHGVDLVIDHRAFPLELFNGRPTPKNIIDAEIVAIAGLRPEVDWSMWGAPEATYPITTLPAMAAVQTAKDPEVGGLAAANQLDFALRNAFYRDSRCISVHAEILAVAGDFTAVNVPALDRGLQDGRGLAAVFDDWRIASDDRIKGSPHLLSAHCGESGMHNPGVDYHWTAPPSEGGLPRFTSYDTVWAENLLMQLSRRSASWGPQGEAETRNGNQELHSA